MTLEQIEIEIIPLIEAAVESKANLIGVCEDRGWQGVADRIRLDPIEMFYCPRVIYLMKLLEAAV